MTFARFMELALYHPEHGYYAVRDDRPTRAGDFLTAPETHSIFGRAVARQLDDLWQSIGSPGLFSLVEYGAGTGALALDLLRGLATEGSGLVAAIRYRPVEISAARERAIMSRLEEGGFGEHLGAPAGSVGCILANEFLDALPVHRVVRADGQLRELLVDWRDGHFAELRAVPSTSALAARLAAEGVKLAEGQRAEICLALDGWAADVSRQVERGYVLLIDYGHPAADLYAPTRRDGTLRAYTAHRVHADPFASVGRQDLTAHVDLTAVEQALEGQGWRGLGQTSQAEFLVAVGIDEVLRSVQGDPATTAEQYLALRSSLVRMLDPRAMGGFRVLLFGRGVPDGMPRGFGYKIPARS